MTAVDELIQDALDSKIWFKQPKNWHSKEWKEWDEWTKRNSKPSNPYEQDRDKISGKWVSCFEGIGIGHLNRFDHFLKTVLKIWRLQDRAQRRGGNTKYGDFDDKAYWICLRDAWDGSDNTFYWTSNGITQLYFGMNRPHREYLMWQKELDFLNTLPDEFTIYRGMTVKEYESDRWGISWTLRKDIADYFINKYPRNFSTKDEAKTICSLKVKKRDVIALFNDRLEWEIIYIP